MKRIETNSEIIRELAELIARQGNVIYTHGGSIHADDVYSVAAGSLLMGDPIAISIERVRDTDLVIKGLNDSNAFIVDVGKGRFDHHFRDEPSKRKFYNFEEDGEDFCWTGPDGNLVMIEKSAVARLWEYAGPEICYNTVLLMTEQEPNSEVCCKIAERLDKILISKISDTDTRGQKAAPNFLSAMCSRASAASELGHKNLNETFYDLVKTARINLINYILTEYDDVMSTKDASDLAEEAMSEGHPNWVTLKDKYIKPFKFVEANTTVHYVVSKSNRDDTEWNLQSVDIEEWPLLNDIIRSISGFKKQPMSFLAIFDSKESAEEAAKTLNLHEF